MKVLKLVEIAVAVTFLAMFIVFLLSGSLDGLENRTLEWRSRDCPARESSVSVVSVLISDDCLSRLGKWPVSRSFYADVIDRLASAGARVIAFDIIFEDQLTTGDAGDERFVAACKKFGKVLLPIVFAGQHVFDSETGEMHYLEKIRRPFKELTKAAAGMGFINADFGSLNSDGVLQKTFLAHRHGEEWVPAFSLSIAEVVAGKKAVIDENGIILDKVMFPLLELPPWKLTQESWNNKTSKASLINFPVSQYQESFPTMLFADVIEGNFDESLLRGSIVLVGPSAVGLGDLKLTPHGLKPGVIVHASMLENILSNSFLRAPKILWQILMLIFFSVFTFFILGSKWSFLVTTGFLTVSLWCYYILCYLIFTELRVVLPMTAPVLMTVVHYVTVRFVQLFARLKIANDTLSQQNLQLDRQVKELVALHHVGSRLPAILEMKILADEVVTKFCELRNATAGLLVYFDPVTRQPHALGQLSEPGNDNLQQSSRAELNSLLETACKNKKPVFDSSSSHYSSCLPVLLGDVCWGAICLQDKEESHAARHSDFFWETLLGITGTALENARLYEMAREVSLARVVQENFLPQKLLSFNGYRVFGHSRPATQLGGDYFDFFSFDDRFLVVIIADVMGHGVPAALGMTIVKTSVLQRAKENFSIDTLIDTINETLINIQKQRLMVTAQFVLIDTLEQTTRIFHRGHVFPLKRDVCGTWTIVPCKIAPPLGFKKRADNPETHVDFKAGERLLFFSDGIYESLAEGDEDTMKIAALQEFLAARPFMPIDDACKDMLDHHPSILSGVPQPDDYTVLLIERE